MSKQVTKNQKNDKNKPEEPEQQVFEEKTGNNVTFLLPKLHESLLLNIKCPSAKRMTFFYYF